MRYGRGPEEEGPCEGEDTVPAMVSGVSTPPTPRSGRGGRFLAAIDRTQRQRPPVAVVVAVFRKGSEDALGAQCAALTYYGFMGLFPLLLVLVTGLGYVLSGRPGLQRRILDSALADFPVIGIQLRDNITSLRGSGLALATGIIVAGYGGLRLGRAVQDSMARMWGVARDRRGSVLRRTVRGLVLLGALGLAILAGAALGWFVARNAALGTPVRVVAAVARLAIDLALFAVTFRVLTARPLTWRAVLPGAAVAAVGWEILQSVGELYVTRVLARMSPTYGAFALVIGLLLWIAVQCRVVLYSAEVNVVLAEELWPRSLAGPTTGGDDRARALRAAAAGLPLDDGGGGTDLR